MYDPISGRGKIPAADYSGMEWHRMWLRECREADKLIESGLASPELARSARGRRRLYAASDARERKRAYDRERKARQRAKQKAPQTAGTELQDRHKNTSRS